MGDYDDYFSNTSYYPSNGDDEAFTILGKFLIITSVLSVVIFIATVVGLWKIFTKAGKEGWKSIIPIYNYYVLFQIAWDVKYFWYYLIGAIVAGVLLVLDLFIPLIPALIALAIYIYLLYITVKLNYNLSRSFGESGCFTVGLVFLTPIFYIILGFSKNAVYKGNISINQKGINQNFNSTAV